MQAFLARIPLFAALTTDDLPDVLRTLRPLPMVEREVVFRQGSVGDACYVVQSGAIEVRVGDLAVATMGPGEVFGELALIDGAPRSASAVCTGAGTLYRLDKAEFDHLRRELRPAAFKILRVMAVTVSGRLRETNDHIALALAAEVGSTETGKGRARVLLDMFGFWSKS